MKKKDVLQAGKFALVGVVNTLLDYVLFFVFFSLCGFDKNIAHLLRAYYIDEPFSDQVYFGSTCPGPHREVEDLTPANVYGDQKWRAEQQVLAILPDAVCLRLSWMYARCSCPGEHGHFWTALTAALEDESKTISWPVHDCRGLTDVEYVVSNLEKALDLPGGIWNFGSENEKNTYATVKTALEEAGLRSALMRLRPNEEAFAGDPRDISMDMGRLRAAGINFPTTAQGLRRALDEWKKVNCHE